MSICWTHSNVSVYELKKNGFTRCYIIFISCMGFIIFFSSIFLRSVTNFFLFWRRNMNLCVKKHRFYMGVWRISIVCDYLPRNFWISVVALSCSLSFREELGWGHIGKDEERTSLSESAKFPALFRWSREIRPRPLTFTMAPLNSAVTAH